MGGPSLLFGMLCFLGVMTIGASAGKAACHDPFFGQCYGILHTCPAACPRLCEVDCRLCKPYCACDRPGAVCQDPRFIGGDGVMFYFHGKKDKDFCLVSDPSIHINAHFIGKSSSRGRDFTWVESVGILFGSHKLYIGARRVSKWEELANNMLIRFDGEEIKVPMDEGQRWWSPETGLEIRRPVTNNKVEVKMEDLFAIVARVVPITAEESRVHGYNVTEDNCYAHLELNFKFYSLSPSVDGVLGQTYKTNYQSRVKITAPMPIMGGADRFAASGLFARDCAVSSFGWEVKPDLVGNEESFEVACGSAHGGRGIVCRR